MKTYQLRTYHFRSSESLRMIAERWHEYVGHLQASGVQTHGLFRSHSRPNAIIVLLSYEDTTAPETLTPEASIAFLAALAGVDSKQIIRADDLPLEPLPLSPLQ